MSCAPTRTVATPTVTAAAVPSTVCAHRRLDLEPRALTVVIVFLQLLLLALPYLRLSDAGWTVVGSNYQTG
jgi:hypothetical protein